MVTTNSTSNKREDRFASLHPAVSFLFFAIVIVVSICVMNPIVTSLSLAAAIAYHIYLKDAKALRFALLYMLPTLILVVTINALFVHRGQTQLLMLPWGQPLMLESCIFGIESGTILICTIEWFACFSAVITSDKFIFLFGKTMPAGSLILCSTLRFIPLFASKMHAINQGQKNIEQAETNASKSHPIARATKVLSTMISWSMENAIETADSMKSRGYGLKNRSSFSIYKMSTKDSSMLIWIIITGVITIAAWICGTFAFDFYPFIEMPALSIFTIVIYLLFFLLCLSPLIINIVHGILWKYKMSKIRSYKSQDNASISAQYKESLV